VEHSVEQRQTVGSIAWALVTDRFTVTAWLVFLAVVGFVALVAMIVLSGAAVFDTWQGRLRAYPLMTLPSLLP
jgi:hypothetical protein